MKNKGYHLIQEMQRLGKPTFTVSEAMKLLQLSRPSVMSIITRLRHDQMLVTLTNGLYAILHPTEQTYGLRPLRILSPLMQYLKLEYYVGLLSAANHWGAAHYKPQILQVIVCERRFLRRLERLSIRLYFKKNYSKSGILRAKNPSGYFPISCPELTALDVISYERASGGFNNVCFVVCDLIGQMEMKRLMNCCKNYGTMSSVQRLGYLMEKCGAPASLLKTLQKWIKTQKPFAVPLRAGDVRRGSIHRDWNIIENATLEIEK